MRFLDQKNQLFPDINAVDKAYNHLGYYTDINNVPELKGTKGTDEDKRGRCHRASVKLVDGSITVYKAKEKQSIMAP